MMAIFYFVEQIADEKRTVIKLPLNQSLAFSVISLKHC